MDFQLTRLNGYEERWEVSVDGKLLTTVEERLNEDGESEWVWKNISHRKIYDTVTAKSFHDALKAIWKDNFRNNSPYSRYF